MRRFVSFACAICTAFACAEPPNGPSTGSVDTIWRNTELRGQSIPVVDGTAVYHLEQETHVAAAVRKSNGATLWRRTLPVSNPGSDGYGLALAGGHLVVGDLDIFGLDPSTGGIEWRFLPTFGQHPGFSSLTAVGDIVYSGSTTGHVYAIDARTGAEKWVRTIHQPGTQVFAPRVVEGVIYAGLTDRPAVGPAIGGVLAIDTSGVILWKTMLPLLDETGGAVTSAVAVIGSEVVVGGDNAVFFLDRASGAIKETWGAAVFGDPAPTDHRVHYAEPHLLVGTGGGMAFAFDPATRAKVWQRRVFGGVRGFASDESRVYVALFGRFHALRLSDGVVGWTLPSGSSPTNERFIAPPALEGNRIYLAGTVGVYAFLKR